MFQVSQALSRLLHKGLSLLRLHRKHAGLCLLIFVCWDHRDINLSLFRILGKKALKCMGCRNQDCIVLKNNKFINKLVVPKIVRQSSSSLTL